MFKTQNFCHIASNNRNQVKVGVFVYRTTDDLATVLTSGYFNDRIIDINLHDLIIHEKVDSADATKVQRNLLCVTERTLENVGTSVIKSKWEGDIEQAITALQEYVDATFVKKDGTSVMTAPLKFASGSMRGAVGSFLNGVSFWKMDAQGNITNTANITDVQFYPVTTNSIDLGKDTNIWKDLHVARVITSVLNNGYDIAVPVTNSADTLALKSQVDDAANSGEQLYTTGVWYAKMYAATTVPTGAEYEGRNYADFSQVDGNNDPIIVVYTYTSGAWVLTETITPPKNHNGYMTITSKIWDIVEQAGQQGGLVLWAHNQGTFTPYPRIVSFQDAALTGTPTAPTLTAQSPNNQIVNKQSLESALANHGTGRNVGDVFFTMRTDSGLNGAVECNGGTYSTTDFTGAQSIGQLLEDGKVPYVSLANYATALTTNGSVGVFGWDGTGTTTFRVPSLNDIFVETGTAAQIGDYLSAGLPNITGTAGSGDGWDNSMSFAFATGAFAAQNSLYGRSSNNGEGTRNRGFNFDASRSSSIYGNSTTVQPKSVRYRAMVQLAITASDEAFETCTQVLADVANLNSYPKVYKVNGIILSSATDPIRGAGRAIVTLYSNGFAKIDFEVKISTSGSSNTDFSFGIDPNLLHSLNNNVPVITPSVGTCTYYTTTGEISTTKQAYGGGVHFSNGYWSFGRVYQTDGAYGGWSAAEFVINQMISGTCYGTYTV